MAKLEERAAVLAGAVALGILILLAVSQDLPVRALPPAASGDVSLDELLGLHRRQALARELAAKPLGGQTHAWERYAAWGKQLLTHGQVKDPPTGPAPSMPLSDSYRCVHCHNLGREDARLVVQDPRAREELVRQARFPNPSVRDGGVLSLSPGTTLWGAVNRERFYNGHYSRYHRLRLGDGNTMNPTRLEDAIQICCNYCSSGRFPEGWELDGMRAYLWELELKLKDLDLDEADRRQVLHDLASAEPQARQRARERLQASYLRAAGATLVEPPDRHDATTDYYGDGGAFRGDAAAGKLIYQSACLGCHGTAIHDHQGPELVRNENRFYRFVWHGTERNGLYMPLFTAERLSRKQVADVRAYLQSLR